MKIMKFNMWDSLTIILPHPHRDGEVTDGDFIREFFEDPSMQGVTPLNISSQFISSIPNKIKIIRRKIRLIFNSQGAGIFQTSRNLLYLGEAVDFNLIPHDHHINNNNHQDNIIHSKLIFSRPNRIGKMSSLHSRVG